MEFQKTNLGELSVNGKGSYGIAASAVPYSDELFTYLRITDINDDGTLNKSGLMSVSDEKAEQYLLKPNDIVFARTGGSTGRNYFYDGTDGEFVYAGFLIKFSIDSTKVNPRFIKYYCLSQEYRGWVHSFNTGSTRGNINAQTYANMPILLPSREQQDLLVDTLSVIDEKIKLNTAINENLEQQAQAYFVDLFITNVDPNWRIGTISDLGNVVGGGTPSKKIKEYYTSDGIAWITPKDLSNDKSKFVAHGETDITELGLAKSSATLMPKCAVLFSSRAPIGYIAIADGQVCTNQGFKSIVPFDNVGTAFVYYFLKENLSAIENVASGSTFKEVSGSTMKNFTAIIPDNDTLAEFQRFCSPLFEQQRALEYENRYLSSIRDTFLPKLMNGEIDVSAVQI